MRHKRIALALAVLSFLCFPAYLFAHGPAAQTFTSITREGYDADLDYDILTLETNQGGSFTFNLFTDLSRRQPIQFTDLWVRLMAGEDVDGKRGETLFAGPIYKTEFGGAGFLYNFAKAGKYTLGVRYNDNGKPGQDKTVTEASFPLTVVTTPEGAGFTFGNEFFLGVLVGLVAGYLLKFRLKKWSLEPISK